MKVLSGLVLSLIIISSVGFAYSQNDTIPSWIKGVAGFWAEDKVTDQEFIEALEFLLESNVIQIDDSQKVQELEKENQELKLEISKLKQLESSSNKTVHLTDKMKLDPLNVLDGFKQALPENVKMHIQPVKSIYTVGDVIQIIGKIDLLDPEKMEYDLGGNRLDMKETVSITVKYLDKNNSYQSAFSNHCYVTENYCSSGGEFLLNLADKKKPTIGDNGTISFSNSISVTEKSVAGIYIIIMSHSIKDEVIGFDYTEPFTVE